MEKTCWHRCQSLGRGGGARGQGGSGVRVSFRPLKVYMNSSPLHTGITKYIRLFRFIDTTGNVQVVESTNHPDGSIAVILHI